MTDNRNTILAVILSGLVLIAWQYFYNVPQMEKQRAQCQTQAELAKPTQQASPGATPGSTTPQAGSTPATPPPVAAGGGRGAAGFGGGLGRGGHGVGRAPGAGRVASGLLCARALF